MPGLVSCLFVPVCSAPLWRLSAVKPPLTLVAPGHCADRILHTPLCTPCRPPAGTFTHWHIQRMTARNTQTYAAAHTYATRPSVVEHMMDGPMRDHFTSERPPLPLPFFLLPHSQDTVFTFRRDIGSNVICLLGQLTYIDYLICHQKINTGVGASANHTSKSNSERNLSKKKNQYCQKISLCAPVARMCVWNSPWLVVQSQTCIDQCSYKFPHG